MIGKVRIQTGETNRLELDGVDISHSITGFTVQFGVDHLPLVRLDVVADPEMDLEFAEVLVDERSREVLTQLGWTPPTEGEQVVSRTPSIPSAVGPGDQLAVVDA